MKIRKVTIGVTLLMHESEEDRLSTMSLARIGEEMDFGDMVGSFAIISSLPVAPETLRQELLALGNDGTFFGEAEDSGIAADIALVHPSWSAERPASVQFTRPSTIGALICELLETRMARVETSDQHGPDVVSDVHGSRADIVTLSSVDNENGVELRLSLDDGMAFSVRIEPVGEPVVDPQPNIGARVRIRPRQRIGGDRYANREGVIVRKHFAGFYVRLDRTPRERSQKTELVEVADLEVLAPPAHPRP